MAAWSHQQNLSGFLYYVSDDRDFTINIHTIDGQYTFYRMGGSQCITPASNADSVGIIKNVLTPPNASVICSYAAVLIKSQPPVKVLNKLTIKDPQNMM